MTTTVADTPPPVGTPTSHTPPFAPSVLPPSLFEVNPPLYCRLLSFIQSTVGLSPADRLVLGGVFQHLPVLDSTATTTLLHHVLLLDARHLKLLADLFTAGLLDARSWGGSRKGYTRSGTGTPVTPVVPPESLTTNPEYNELFRRLSIVSPFPPPPPSSDRPTTTSQRVKRSAKLSRLCLERQNDECPITAETDIALETAHLIPFSIATPRRADTAFWLMLAVCFGPDLRDHLHTIIHGKKSFTTVNSLALQSVLHKYFDRGAIALEPDLPLTSSFDPATITHFDVAFRWRDTLQGLRLRVTLLPLDPESQITSAPDGSWSHTTLSEERCIQDSNKFRLYTDDPERLPLPHPFLLSLHARLWRMIQSAGLAETIDRKRKRLGKACVREDNDNEECEGSDDDSDSDGARKCVKRTKRRPRSTKTTSGKGRKRGENRSVPPHPPARSPSSPRVHGSAQDTHPTLPFDSTTAPPCSSPASAGREPEVQIPFLEQQYLAFRLGNPDSSNSSHCSDSDTDCPLSTPGEYGSDDSRDDICSFSGDLFSDDDSGSESDQSNGDTSGSLDLTLVESKPFLELQWERLTGSGRKRELGRGRTESVG